MEVIRISQSISMHTSKIFTTYNSFYVVMQNHLIFPTEPHGIAFSPHKVRKEKHVDQKVNSSGFLMSFPRQRNDQTDLEFLNLHRVKTTKYLIGASKLRHK